jgi:hypothetical protein
MLFLLDLIQSGADTLQESLNLLSTRGQWKLSQSRRKSIPSVFRYHLSADGRQKFLDES